MEYVKFSLTLFWILCSKLLLVSGRSDDTRKNFFLEAERKKGKVGETLVFYIRYNENMLENKQTENYLVSLQYRHLGVTKVFHQCLASELLQEDMEPVIVNFRNEFIYYNHVRKFEFTLWSVGFYDVLAVLSWGEVNKKQQESDRILDMRNVTVEVIPNSPAVPAEDCLLKEIFTINGKESSEDTSKHLVKVQNFQWIIVSTKALDSNCSERGDIHREWKIHRFYKVTPSDSFIPSHCFHSKYIGQVDLVKLTSHFTSFPLPFPTDLKSFTVQPYILPSGFYRICLELSRDYDKGTYNHSVCGFFTIHQAVKKELFRILVTPVEESFTWPKSNLLIDASKSYYVYELPESGYADKPSIRFRWSCSGNVQICDNITSHLEALATQALDLSNVNSLLKVSSLQIRESWIIPNVVVKITLNISARNSYSDVETVESVEKVIIFANKNEATHYSPYIHIRCLINCWHFVNPMIPILLGFTCYECEQFSSEFVKLTWELHTDRRISSLIGGTNTMYFYIENLAKDRVAEITVKIKFSYKSLDGLMVISSSTRRFQVLDVFPANSMTRCPFEVRSESVDKQIPTLDISLPFVNSPNFTQLAFPLILSLKVSYPCRANWIYYMQTKSCYSIHSSPLNFYKARKYCLTIVTVAGLATIDTPDQLNFLRDKLTSAGLYFWVGRFYETKFTQEDADRVNGSFKYCVGLAQSGDWNPFPCGVQHSFICQYKLESTAEQVVLLRTMSSAVSVTHQIEMSPLVEVYFSLPTGSEVLCPMSSNIKSVEPTNLNKSVIRAHLDKAVFYDSTFLELLIGFVDDYNDLDKDLLSLPYDLLKYLNTKDVINYSNLALILKVLESVMSVVDIFKHGLVNPIEIIEKVLAFHAVTEGDTMMDDYVFGKIFTLVERVETAIRYAMTVNIPHTQITTQEAQKILIRVVDLLTMTLTRRTIQRYPIIKALTYNHSILTATWLDCRLVTTIFLELNHTAIRLNAVRLKEALNPFSLDPFLNIGVYATTISPFNRYFQKDILINTTVVFLRIQQKQPRQYPLEDFFQDAINLNFRISQKDVNTTRMSYKLKVYESQQTQGKTYRIKQSDCLFLQIKPSSWYGTMLAIKSNSFLSFEVTSELYRLKLDTLDIFTVSSQHIQALDRNATKTAKGVTPQAMRGNVFLPQLSRREESEYRYGYYYVLVRLTPNQNHEPRRSVDANESSGDPVETDAVDISMECMRVTCVQWLNVEHMWTSQNCRPTGSSNTSSEFSCTCSEGQVFSAGSGPCMENMTAASDDYSIAVVDTDQFVHFEIPFFILCLWIVYLSLLIKCHGQWRVEELCGKTHVISSLFSPYQEEQFIVCVVTGWIAGSGTSDNISMVLVGSKQTTSVYRLSTISNLFKTGSEIWFLLSCNKKLGNLKSIIFILDPREKYDAWFPQHVYLRNLKTNESWFCMFETLIPDTLTGNRFVIKQVLPHSGAGQNFFLFNFVNLMRKFHICVGSVFNIQGSRFTKELHALACFCCIVIIMDICSWKIGLLTTMLKGDQKSLPKPHFIDDLVVSVCVAFFPTAFLVLTLAILTDKPLKDNVLRWLFLSVFTSNDDSDTSDTYAQTSRRYESQDLSTSTASSRKSSQENYYQTPLELSSYSRFYQQMIDEGGSSEDDNWNSSSFRRVDGNPWWGSFSLSDDDEIDVGLAYRPDARSSDSGSSLTFADEAFRPLSYYLRKSLMNQHKSSIVLPADNVNYRSPLSFANINRNWLFRDLLHKKWDSAVLPRLALDFVKFLMVMFIVMDSYIYIVTGVIALQRRYFLQLVLATFVIIVFIVHPLILFIAALVLPDQAYISFQNSRSRIGASKKEMSKALKMTMLNKVASNRLVGTEQVYISAKWKRVSIKICKLLAQAESRHSQFQNIELGKVGIRKHWTILFITVIFIIINVQNGSVSQRHLQNTYFKTLLNIDEDEASAKMVPSVEYIWDQLRNTFHLKLHNTLFSQKTMSTFKVVTNVKLSQKRVRKYEGNCGNDFPDLIEPSCRFDIESSVSETRNFALSWNKPINRTDITGPFTSLDGEPYITKKHSYFEREYAALFSLRDTHPHKIEFLKDSKWIDEKTRLVVVELTVFNADTSLLTTVIHSYEFTAAGIFEESILLYTCELFFERGSFALRIFLVIFMFLTIFLIYHDVVEVYVLGLAEYCLRPVSWMNLIEHAACFIIIFLFIKEYTIRKNAIQTVLDVYFKDTKFDAYINFTVIASISFQLTLFCCIIAITSFIKIIMETRHLQVLAQFLELLPPVLKVTYFPVLSILSFSVLAHFFFTEMRQFSTFSDAILTLTELIVDQHMIQKVVNYYWFLGPLFFGVSQAYLNYIVMNYYIIFMSECYSRIYALNRYQNRERRQTRSGILLEVLNWIKQRTKKAKTMEARREPRSKAEPKPLTVDFDLRDKAFLNVKCSVNYDESISVLNELVHRDLVAKKKSIFQWIWRKH